MDATMLPTVKPHPHLATDCKARVSPAAFATNQYTESQWIAAADSAGGSLLRAALVRRHISQMLDD